MRGERQAIHAFHLSVEKPNLETARTCLQEGDYFWNAGMFVHKASMCLKALGDFRPDILRATQAAWASKTEDGSFTRPGKAEFAAIPIESVDYTLMEHCPRSKLPITMVALDAGWSDLGACEALNVLPKDAQGNAHVGGVLIYHINNTLVQTTSRLVTLVGVQDLVFVENPDAVLVANKHSSQDVKYIVNQLT